MKSLNKMEGKMYLWSSFPLFVLFSTLAKGYITNDGVDYMNKRVIIQEIMR